MTNRRSIIPLNELILKGKYSERYTKQNIYRIVHPKEKKKELHLRISSPQISFEKIEKMTNKYQLKILENKYDEFLEKYLHLMMLYDNNIEEYLETRDALTKRINNIERLEKIKIKDKC